ncbi:hypothetical protein ALC57_10817 [Trachymyrmex cornetzi]|uniref:Uncharacterized protein n=1 Tax=Trachymyrmex cornetzi TaxID=471704 RepID=A0A151J3L1_9HYME|nr:hypothetical protein ALC57_10817 [Trachymyrmex cornetzi]
MDAASREHDIAYSHSNDLTERHTADNILAEKARKRITASDSTLKRGGILHVLPLLGVLGSLVGGAAGVAKAVNDSKAAQRQLEELQRHTRVMEGSGVSLASNKRGRGVNRVQSHASSALQSEQLRAALSTVSTIG